MSKQQTYDPTTHGRSSQAKPGTEALRQEWAMAAEANATPHPKGGEFVPRDALFVRDDISPREGANVDRTLVSHYASIADELPPIRVQRGTFVVLDGWHRLHAAYLADNGRVLVRIEELDVPDDELREAAFAANVSHGRALTARERTAHLRYLIGKHGEDWSIATYSQAAGVSRDTVIQYRTQARAKAERAAQVVDFRLPDEGAEPAEPAKVRGVDGKEYPRRERPAPVQSFDPGRDPDPEPPFEDAASELSDTDVESWGADVAEEPAAAPAPDGEWIPGTLEVTDDEADDPLAGLPPGVRAAIESAPAYEDAEPTREELVEARESARAGAAVASPVLASEPAEGWDESERDVFSFVERGVIFRGELSIVRRGGDIDEVLSRLTERFGSFVERNMGDLQ